MRRFGGQDLTRLPVADSTAELLSPGEILGGYTLFKRIAEGGMGEVYLGAQLQGADFGPLLALKVLKSELADDQSFVDMLHDEANISRQLDHPNIIRVADLGHHNGHSFLVMEYVHGVTLETVLSSFTQHSTQLDLAIVLYLSIELCRALSYAHERVDAHGKPMQIIHRDVTPANVMVTADGALKLTDFGLAKAKTRFTHTVAGVLKGRFGYMPPEQLRYEQMDARADVFSAGVVMYEMACGRHPTGDANLMEALDIFEKETWSAPSQFNPHVPPQLDQIISKALVSQPATRWASARALQSSIEGLVQAWLPAWPDAGSGRQRLSSILPQMYPHLAAAPIDPVQVGLFLETSRAAGMFDEGVIARPRDDIDDEPEDATLVRAISSPLANRPEVIKPARPLTDPLRVGPIAHAQDPGLAATAPVMPVMDFGNVIEATPIPVRPHEDDRRDTLEAIGDPLVEAIHLATEAIANTPDATHALEGAVDEALFATGSHRALVVICPTPDHRVFRIARARDKRPLDNPEAHTAISVFDDASRGEIVSTQAMLPSGARVSVACIPLRCVGVTSGFLYLDRTSQDYTHRETKLLSTIATAIALVVENEGLKAIAG